MCLPARSTVGPLRSLMAQLAPFLNEAEPVHGDLETLEVLVADQVVSMHTHDSFTIKVVVK